MKHWRVSGYVNARRGRVIHTIDDRMTFSNVQIVDIAQGRGDATQRTASTRRTSTTAGGVTRVRNERSVYPLVVNATYPPPLASSPNGLTISADVHRALLHDGSDGSCAMHIDGTAILQRRKAHDDGIMHGRTVESNVCQGGLGSFAIVKAARNGVLLPAGASR